jgi:co-chaperonin GroES (HSP10)
MIKPNGFYVLVEMEEVEETTESGIVVSTGSQKAREQGGHDVGIVLDIGPTAHRGYDGCDAETPEGRAAQWGYKIGDKVQFDRYQGKLIDDKYRLITDVQIKGVHIGDEE